MCVRRRDGGHFFSDRFFLAFCARRGRKEKAPGDARRELSLFEFLLESITNKHCGSLAGFLFRFFSSLSAFKSVTPSKDSSSHVCSNEVFPAAEVLIMSGLCRVINTVIASHSPVITCISLLTALPPALFSPLRHARGRVALQEPAASRQRKKEKITVIRCKLLCRRFCFHQR